MSLRQNLTDAEPARLVPSGLAAFARNAEMRLIPGNGIALQQNLWDAGLAGDSAREMAQGCGSMFKRDINIVLNRDSEGSGNFFYQFAVTLRAVRRLRLQCYAEPERDCPSTDEIERELRVLSRIPVIDSRSRFENAASRTRSRPIVH